MQTVAQYPTQPAQPVKELTELDVIAIVRGYVLERKTALTMHKNTAMTDKLTAIEDLLLKLNIAEGEARFNPKKAIKTVLNCSLNLHYIAPTSTIKLFKTWHTKVEYVMQACRNYLSLTKQTNI